MLFPRVFDSKIVESCVSIGAAYIGMGSSQIA